MLLDCQKTKVDSWPCECGRECETLLRTRYHKCKRACLNRQPTGNDREYSADTPTAPACSLFSWPCECEDNCCVDFCHKADGLSYVCRYKHQERISSYRECPPLVVGRWDAGDEIKLLLDDHTQCTRRSLLTWELDDVEFGPDIYTNLGETVPYYIPYQHYARYVKTGEVNKEELKDVLRYEKNRMPSNVAEEILKSSSEEEDLDIDPRYLPKNIATRLGLKTPVWTDVKKKCKDKKTSGYARPAAPCERDDLEDLMQSYERNSSLVKKQDELEYTISKLSGVDLDDSDSDEEYPRYCQADLNLTAKQFVKKYRRARKDNGTKIKSSEFMPLSAHLTRPRSRYK